MTRVQICGITSIDDAVMCEEEEVDAIGLVLVEGRSRSVTPNRAREICDSLGPFIQKTGIIFGKHPKEILSIADRAGVEIIQTYSQEPQQIEELQEQGFKIITSFLVDPVFTTNTNYDMTSLLRELYNVCDLILFEPVIEGQFGGQGLLHDYQYLSQNYIPYCKKFGIAGGLNPKNVDKALDLQPYVVDVSSGVEVVTGKKSRSLVREFVAKCKRGGKYD